MSALVILRCNACDATTQPALHAMEARELAQIEGWVCLPGDDIDYCPPCTSPAGAVAAIAARRELDHELALLGSSGSATAHVDDAIGRVS